MLGTGTSRPTENSRVETLVNIIRIVKVRFFPEDVYEGGIDIACYDGAWIEEIECESVEDAVHAIESYGLTFAATGNYWAADPDGSRITDYRTGKREEVSAHLEPGWSDAEIDAIMAAVG